MIGLQGRSIDPNPVKYITVMFDDNAPKIYGLDDVEKSEAVYVTEGPFDSTFIRNAIAMCGPTLMLVVGGLTILFGSMITNHVIGKIVNRIDRTIDKGEVVIFPSSIDEKDINDMVIAGHDVQKIVECNTYSGLEAKLKFNTWKKV